MRKSVIRFVAALGIAAFAAAPNAQTPTVVTNPQVKPVEIQILDQAATPVIPTKVAINNVPMTEMGVGRYTYVVEGPKVAITIHLPNKGLQPIVIEEILAPGKFVYIEVRIDPDTGAVKSVFQKATKAAASGAQFFGHIGRNTATGVGSQSAGGVPANDNCGNSIPIAEGLTPFSTIGATTDGPNHPGACQFGNGETVNDIWFVYTASGNGVLTVSTCGIVDYDSDLVIYDGNNCATLLADLLECNDDGTGCAGFSSELEAPVVLGNEYLIRVGGYGAFGDDSEGSGNLSLSLDLAGGPPVNDDCADALNLDCNTTATFDNTFATTEAGDPAFSCHFGGAAQGVGSVWYSFVADATEASLSTNLSAGGDSLLAVYSGTCGALTELECSEDEGIGLLSQLTVSGLTIGNTYYVQVASFDTGSQGEYTLDLVCAAPPTGRCCLPDGSCFDGVSEDECLVTLGGNDWLEGATCLSDPCPQPVANDDCDDAIALGTLPVSVTFDNSGATTDLIAIAPCGVASGPFRNVWYSFVGTGKMTRVTTCRAGTLNPDTKISVFCGDCGAPLCVGGNDDNCAAFSSLNSTFDFCSQLGTTYLVSVGDFSATTGGGQIQLAISSNNVTCTPTVACDPPGACCLPDRCINAGQVECANSGGVFQGVGTRCFVNSVKEGGFEDGPFGGSWTEFSSNFGTPICDLTCGTGGGTPPFEGDYWAWFGGVNGLVETGSVEQTGVVIPTGAISLKFYLDIPASSGNGIDFLNVRVDGNIIFSVLEGDPAYTPAGWTQVAIPLAPFNDGMLHTLRFESTTFGTGFTNFFVDDIEIARGVICEECVVIDFETDDDGLTPLVNGQDLSTPPEFGTYFVLSDSGLAQGAAIFDTTPGVNPNDVDLWVSKGNVLINQENSGQAIPGIFNAPDDCSCGAVFYFDFLQPVEMKSLVIVDIDSANPSQEGFITLIDSAFRTRTYHLPSGFTEDVFAQGPPGWRTVDLTTLAPQAGFAAVGTAVEDPGFDSDDVVRMEVTLASSGAIDDIEFCF